MCVGVQGPQRRCVGQRTSVGDDSLHHGSPEE